MGKTAIEWTDRVWNPVTGCTKVSEGCRNCYAEGIARRFWGERKFSDVRIHPERLEQPIHWRKPSKIFVNSMSDLFHPAIFDDLGEETFIDEIFAVMAATPWHTYQVLTKRATAMRDYMNDKRRAVYVEHSLETIYGEHGWCSPDFEWPLPNVWLGVSAEDQQSANERIPVLLETEAALRFVSCEPLLEKVTIFDYLCGICMDCYCGGLDIPPHDHEVQSRKIDWVICGGESGPHARPMHPDWVRSLLDQCVEAENLQCESVPFFFKQWGEWTSEYPQGRNLAYIQMAYQNGLSFYRVGKKTAGALLNGVEYKLFPKED